MNVPVCPWRFIFAFTDIHRQPWIPTDMHGYPSISMDMQEYPMISMDTHRSGMKSMDIYGYQYRISIDYLWLCKVGSSVWRCCRVKHDLVDCISSSSPTGADWQTVAQNWQTHDNMRGIAFHVHARRSEIRPWLVCWLLKLGQRIFILMAVLENWLKRL